MVVLVDHDDVRFRAPKRSRGSDTCKPAADDDDTWLLGVHDDPQASTAETRPCAV
jgi:hypothetical protein